MPEKLKVKTFNFNCHGPPFSCQYQSPKSAKLELKIALTKYNIERNLRILYDHRTAVLGQYREFEAAIGDEPESREAKNAFRLEIARVIFSDPQTGYLGKDSGSNDVNVNPVFSLFAKITRP